MDRDRERSALQRDHRDSVAEFITAAESVPASAWESPLAPGKWSPAQVAEHLRLSYEVINKELSGQPGLRVRTSWWLRLILRLRVLPSILREGRIREGAQAPREIRPGPGPFPRDPLLARLRAVSADAEARLTGRPEQAGAGITHHVFGRLSPARALRFLAVHNGHHTRQLTSSDIPPGGD
ncbi:MAG: DinB family protein [Gemmatimonadota bacterium]|nr:DinB family protein [Gemmatimonadota bacterium]MDH4348261.1 DinB family protein [Gemmatimonadota bacterium]MDH5283134.1 DinB family protein [Gemmatimonadota bacterium]